MTKCDGSCEEHVGNVVRVRVFHSTSGTDWGEFDYCEEAIAEDERRGFTVVQLPVVSVDELNSFSGIMREQ